MTMKIDKDKIYLLGWKYRDEAYILYGYVNDATVEVAYFTVEEPRGTFELVYCLPTFSDIDLIIDSSVMKIKRNVYEKLSKNKQYVLCDESQIEFLWNKCFHEIKGKRTLSKPTSQTRLHPNTR